MKRCSGPGHHQRPRVLPAMGDETHSPRARAEVRSAASPMRAAAAALLVLCVTSASSAVTDDVMEPGIPMGRETADRNLDNYDYRSDELPRFDYIQEEAPREPVEATSATEVDSNKQQKIKKWTDPDEKNKVRMVYNYLLSRRMGNDIFGKRMGSSFPTKNFRFFTSDLGSVGGLHGSEFLGKRGLSEGNLENYMPVSEFLGKRARASEFLGKRSKVSEFLGKRGRVSEFLGKRAGASEFLGKRARVSEFLGKRARVSEFLGKRSNVPNLPLKRARISEFLGKRAAPSAFVDQIGRMSRFHIVNPSNENMSGKRARVSEFLGKRSDSGRIPENPDMEQNFAPLFVSDNDTNFDSKEAQSKILKDNYSVVKI